MPRTITRNSRMDKSITFRATPEDVVNLKKAAQEVGMDNSGFIRSMLIQKNINNPI